MCLGTNAFSPVSGFTDALLYVPWFSLSDQFCVTCGGFSSSVLFFHLSHTHTWNACLKKFAKLNYWDLGIT